MFLHVNKIEWLYFFTSKTRPALGEGLTQFQEIL